MGCSRDNLVFDQCETVRCPCPGGCPGHLRADGRNVLDSLTFLECDACHCAYVAEDFPRVVRKEKSE